MPLVFFPTGTDLPAKYCDLRFEESDYHAATSIHTGSAFLLPDLQTRSESDDWYEKAVANADAAIKAVLKDVAKDFRTQSDALAKYIDSNIAAMEAWLDLKK
jgi:hypothetical protein